MSAANLNSRLKTTMASVKNGQPTGIQQEQIFNITEDLAIALGVNDDTPMSKDERDERMKLAEIRNKKCTYFNNKLAELKDAAMKGDAEAGAILKTAEFECHNAIRDYENLPDRFEKLKLQRRMIQKVQAEGGGKRTKSRKSKKSRKTRKHRK